MEQFLVLPFLCGASSRATKQMSRHKLCGVVLLPVIQSFMVEPSSSPVTRNRRSASPTLSLHVQWLPYSFPLFPYSYSVFAQCIQGNAVFVCFATPDCYFGVITDEITAGIGILLVSSSSLSKYHPGHTSRIFVYFSK